ncbi:MFS transporter [Actinophytocola gossypii]|uniref:MFS transporter n=1 Tax=Actinophytocola gossypii TaxID=2812003 RepID=A0ABT2JGG7_9PSEU|nr:MFS transporter [Actinophytocola gossypii]MCT2586972.1 MFS transporter [Actinophytocola gossypii]
MTARQTRRRYLVLLALRWFPVGLWVPITVLLPLDRGLTLAEAGLAASIQGFVVLALELPTGGLSDSWGRRPVLLASATVGAVSVALMTVADTFAVFAAVYLLQGVYRALDSGPLEAWYVDAALAEDPNAKLERGLSAGGTVLGASVGAGALVTGAIVAWAEMLGIPTLVLPVILALIVQLAGLAAIALLVHEPPHPAGRRRFLASVRDVPRVVADGVRIVRGSRILVCLLLVELSWGFGMVTFEALLPVRMTELLGGEEAAAAIMGPAGAAAWLASAAGAALVPLLTSRLGVAVSAALLRVVHGVTVVGMGLLAGPVGALTGYLATYLVHGTANPPHMTLLHREVTSTHRSTVVSMNSMVAQPAGSIGAIVLTALATGTSVSTAIVVGAVVLALAAPLYLPAARAERRRPAAV